MKRLVAALAGIAALAAASSAWAQTTFPTQNPGLNVPGMVEMCLDQSGFARACDPLVPRAVKVVSGIPTGQYPVGSFPIAANASGTTGAVVGTLAAAPGKTTYICGFDVSAIGGTAAVGPIVVAGLTGGSFTYQASASAAGIIISRDFAHCIPAATLNTAITITTTADGTATAVNVNAYGFQL